MSIVRVPLREQVHRALVGRILRDDLSPGARISDSVLAQELGVSRTPVREALLRLEREGFLEVDVGRGFFVKELSAREVREIYPIVWTLEVQALRTSPRPTPERMAELERINHQLALAGDDPEARIELDLAWHRALLGECGNQRLLELVASLKALIWRYEYAYMQNDRRVPVSTRTHEEIAGALARGQIDTAAELLERNWRFTMDELLPWLESSAH
jgi:DNA-binding GntR family transcriptional regulator